MALNDSSCDFLKRPHWTEQEILHHLFYLCCEPPGNLEQRIDLLTNFPFISPFKNDLKVGNFNTSTHTQTDRIIFVLYLLWTVIMSLSSLWFGLGLFLFSLVVVVGEFCFLFFFLLLDSLFCLRPFIYSSFELKWPVCSLQCEHRILVMFGT